MTFARVGKTLNDPLASTQWQLVSPGFAGLDKQPTLQFSENRLNASAGLNQISGEYQVDQRKLMVSPLVSTRMAGPPAVMNAETQYSQALQAARSFELTRNGQTLTLLGDTTLKFERINANQTLSDPLASTQWNLTSPGYAGLQNKPSLRFDGGRVAASVGLNQIGGEYTATGKQIRFDNLLSTQMAGPPALMTAESQYSKALSGIRTFEISRDGKILSLRGAQVLTFERAGQTMDNPLASTQWKLTTPIYAGAGETPTLQFSDNRLSASAGLNQINGEYRVNDQKLTISPLASTRMAGPAALMNAESQYAKSLQAARSFELSRDGQTLILRGDTTLTFASAGRTMNNPLASTQWELSAPTYAGIEKKPTLTFREDSLGASVGLNAMGAGYKLDGSKITLEQFISMMMAGPPALMDAEDQYKKALASVRSYELSRDRQTLILRGDQTLTFTSKAATPQGFVPMETKIINVEPQLGPQLDGDQTPKYLQLEDLSRDVSWGRFTEPKILGFDYQPGNRYQMRVQVERDAQSGEKQLRLLEVFSQRYMGAAQLGRGDVILEVAPVKVDCVGVAPMKCLQVRENGGQWRNFTAPIEGFDFAEGYRTRLQVNVSNIANPPADGSSLRYQLVRVLDKTPVTY